MLQPGPLHAFYERTRARRGHGKAIVATARKLAILFWCMLTRGEDYAHQQPSLTRKKLRRLELTAGAPKNTRAAAGTWSTNVLIRDAERELAQQAETLLPAHGQRPAALERRRGKWARARHRSAHRLGHSTRTSRAADQSSRRLRFATSVTRAHQQPSPHDTDDTARRRHALRKYRPKSRRPDHEPARTRLRTRTAKHLRDLLPTDHPHQNDDSEPLTFIGRSKRKHGSASDKDRRPAPTQAGRPRAPRLTRTRSHALSSG